jgi:hypothetical protein
MVVQVQQGKLRLVYPAAAAEPDVTPIWPYARKA